MSSEEGDDPAGREDDVDAAVGDHAHADHVTVSHREIVCTLTCFDNSVIVQFDADDVNPFCGVNALRGSSIEPDSGAGPSSDPNGSIGEPVVLPGWQNDTLMASWTGAVSAGEISDTGVGARREETRDGHAQGEEPMIVCSESEDTSDSSDGEWEDSRLSDSQYDQWAFPGDITGGGGISYQRYNDIDIITLDGQESIDVITLDDDGDSDVITLDDDGDSDVVVLVDENNNAPLVDISGGEGSDAVPRDGEGGDGAAQQNVYLINYSGVGFLILELPDASITGVVNVPWQDNPDDLPQNAQPGDGDNRDRVDEPTAEGGRSNDENVWPYGSLHGVSADPETEATLSLVSLFPPDAVNFAARLSSAVAPTIRGVRRPARRRTCRIRINASGAVDICVDSDVDNVDWAEVERLLQDMNPSGRVVDLVVSGELLRSLVRRHHIEGMTLLLDRGLAVDATYSHPRMPNHRMPLVYHATVHGATQIVALLVERGAFLGPYVLPDFEVNRVTCLHAAAFCQRAPIVSLLLARFAGDENALLRYIGAKDGCERTALFIAASEGYVDVVEALLGGGAVIGTELEDEDGQTCLHAAADNNHANVVKLLLERVDESRRDDLVNIRDATGCTALALACRQGFANVALVLLRAGADPTPADAGGRTALQDAVSYSRAEAAWLLINRALPWNAGRPLDVRNAVNRDALYYACASGMRQTVAHLAEAGVDLFARYKDGQTCLHVACAHDQMKVVALILEIARRKEQLNFVNWTDTTGRGAVFYACKWGNCAAVAALVSHGADVFAADENGRTPVHTAAEGGYPALISGLARGLDDGERRQYIDRRDILGRTALFDACLHNRPTVIKALLEYGADVTLRDRRGSTCLHLVCKEKRLTAAQALMRHARPDARAALLLIKDRYGRPALWYAQKRSGTRSPIALLLLEHAAALPV